MQPAGLQPTHRYTPTEIERAAFRELHADRLYGFALLLTLGDRALAARLATDALTAGSAQLDRLRHPERAATWLRSCVVRGARRPSGADPRMDVRVRSLAALGADGAVVAGLVALRRVDRAAFIASSIERLDRRDVAVVVDLEGRKLERMLERAMRMYVDAHARASDGSSPRGGPLADRIHDITARALG